MSTDTIFYYLLGILALVACGFTAGTLIATRMSRRRETPDQEWEEAPSIATNSEE